LSREWPLISGITVACLNKVGNLPSENKRLAKWAMIREKCKKKTIQLSLSLSQWVCLGLKTKMTSCKEDIKITCKLMSCNECSQMTTLQTM